MEIIQIDRHYEKVLKIASKGDLASIQTLLKKHPEILNWPNEGHNRTLIWEAVNKNRKELIEYLIAQGADVNISGRYRNQTFVLLKPYCIAHRNGKEDLKNYLLEQGHQMDIFSLSYLGSGNEVLNKINSKRELLNLHQKEDELWKVTPLHFAVAGNNISTLETLLKSGAEVKKYSKLLYEIASRNDQLEIIKQLTKHGGAPSEIDVPNAFYNSNLEIIEYFVSNGLDCDKLFVHDWPPIAYLCRGDKGEHPKKVGALLKYIKNINAQTPTGISAMHAASKAGFLSVLKLLLENGGTINIKDKKGKTPLFYARKHKREAAEDFLLKNGGIE